MQSTDDGALIELSNVYFDDRDGRVLNDISMSIKPGEIHAIVGDRGTGKTSLGRILAYHEMPEKGKRLWKGEAPRTRFRRRVSNPRAQMVYQDEGLIDYFTVAENMFIPEQVFKPFPFSSRRKMTELAEAFIKSHGFDIDPASIYHNLSLSRRVVVNFLRCVFRNPELLVLDEALEKLSGQDLDRVQDLLKTLAKRGAAVILISHRIDDIYDLAQNVSVMREGKIILQSTIGNIDRLNLIKLCYTQLNRSSQSRDLNKEFYQLLRFNEAILKKLPVSLIVTDEKDRIKLVNDHAVDYFSLASRDYLNKPLNSIIEDPSTVESIQRCFNKNEETSLIHETVNGRTVNIKIYPIFDGTFPIGNISIIEDISELEKMRQRMNLSDNLASLGLLAAGVAHEINNPLEIIYNYLSFLRRSSDKQKSMQVVDSLEQEMDGIRQIVSTLISFSGDKQVEKEIFDLNELIEQTLTLLSPAARQRKITCDFEPEKHELDIYATKSEIRQVLLNIIKNGFEVLGEGGSIRVKTLEGVDSVDIYITDDGPGIFEEDPDQVFLPFYSTKKNPGNQNLGLGLPISYGIIKKYGGDIGFRNLPQRGCEFSVRLPRAEPQASGGPR